MWDQRYAGDDYAYGTEPNDFLREQAPSLPVGRTLCIGEGEGRNAVYLAGLGHRVTALDASAVGLEKTRRLAAARGVAVATLHADLAEYTFEPQGWECIVSVFCHLPPAVRARVHAQVPAALAPGGVFLLEAYTPAQLDHGTGGPPRAEMMMDLPTLRRELPGLDLRIAREQEREVHEGAHHTGLGAVVQVVGVRP